MKVSIEIGHPAHVHYWKNVIRILRARGHGVTIFARQKEIALELLRAYALDYDLVGRSRRHLLAKALGIGIDDWRVLRAARANRVELMLSTGIPGSAHASRVLGVPHISLLDTEIATLGRMLTEPFSDAVCTPACFKGKVDPEKHIRFRGYLELMYLHPAHFRPDPSVLTEVGLSPDDRFAIVRFSSWDSSHDVRRQGRVLGTDTERISFIRELAEHYRVLVTSEIALPSALEPFRLRLRPERFHDLLAYASLYAGEGATVASEAGVLGVPWLYISESYRSYLEDQERRFGLGRCVGSVDEAIGHAYEWAEGPTREAWSAKREKLLAESIDVSLFMADITESWPDVNAVLEDGWAHGS